MNASLLAGPAPVGENDALVNGPELPRPLALAASVYSLPTIPLKVQPATFTVPPEAVRFVQDDKVPPEPLAMVRN